MKNTFYCKVERTGAYRKTEIPENVVALELTKKPNGIFLQYVTENDKKNKWATDTIIKYVISLKQYYFDETLGVSFVQLSGGKFGFSKCSKNDKFDPIVGRAVAICHAMGEKIPDFI